MREDNEKILTTIIFKITRRLLIALTRVGQLVIVVLFVSIGASLKHDRCRWVDAVLYRNY